MRRGRTQPAASHELQRHWPAVSQRGSSMPPLMEKEGQFYGDTPTGAEFFFW